MKIQENPKKPFFYYYFMVLLVVMVLNAFIFPTMMKPQITQVDYGTFLRMVDAGAVRKVEIQDLQIGFVAADGAGKETTYVTGKIEDPGLVGRLYDAKVEFSKTIPRENSPLLNSLLNWILPMLLFIGLGQLLMGRLAGKMGGMGNAMAFGNSKAKIYVEAQTG